MALMQWNAKFSVGVDGIDSQHRKLMEIINELHSAMLNGSANATLDGTLEKLIVYTKTHFADEEATMLASGYPVFTEHKAEHDALTKQALELQRRFRTGRAGLSIEVMHFLRDWLEGHILGSDHKYIPYVSKHNKSLIA